MLDAGVTALVVVGDLLFLGKGAAYNDLICGGNVLLGCEVVHDKGYLVPVKDLGGTHGPEGLDGKGTGNVVCKHHVEAAVDDLSVAFDFLVRVALQYFLCKCLRHV